MAPEMSTIYVYDKTGNTLLFTKTIPWNMMTVGELLEYPNFVNNNITEISNTIGGQPLNHEDNPSYFTYYDVSPAETITGFFLDGQEYVLGADLSGYAQCCDIPTDNCQLANGCGYTTCTGTVTSSDLCNYIHVGKNEGITTCVGIGNDSAELDPFTYIRGGSVSFDGMYGSSCMGISNICGGNNCYTFNKCNTGIAQMCDIPTDNCQLANSCNYTTCCYVNDSINSVTAYYITKDAQGDQFATHAELISATTFYSGGQTRVPTKNDYTIVLADECYDNATTRYIYNNTWEYQYTVNETALTQAQLDAINSGITCTKVNCYDCCMAKCCDIPTDNCQLCNSCGYTTCTGTVVATDLQPYAKSCDLCTVATSGKYCDLTGQPTIPTDNCQLSNGCGYTTCTGTLVASDLNDYALSYDVLTKTNTTSYTPTAAYHPATKKYVDDNGAGKTYVGGTGISIPTTTDYSAVQGPCPNGYHIPSREENAAIVDAMTALGINTATGACMKTYLKMPYAGYRNQANGNTAAQGTGGRYWSYLRLNTNAASILSFQSNGLGNSNANAAYGMSIRPFKDIAVIPDNTWTTLFNGSSIATGAGIFHNTTDGIISISADGTTWITIADKNLGATVVYNDGDTLSESNAGGYFQHGNNYKFPFTGSVTTSSTKVDTTDYGPGNYYSSSTFIAVSGDWSSVYNSNLWGGDTGVTIVSNVIYNTGVLSVNGNTGAVTVSEFTPSNAGSTDQVLTKTADGYEWQSPASGGAGSLAEPTNLAVTTSGTTATITWTDPDDLRTIPPTAFSKSVLVRKVGSAPTSPSDGTVVVEETTRNQYKTTGYADTGLTYGTDYYYRVFTYATTGVASYGDSVKTERVERTFTITFTETSSPSGFSPTYSDDAAGLTAGSTDFDEFFGYSAVRLSTAGVETAEITQAQSGGNGKLDITQLGTLTSGDNVMIKFPVRGIKMSKNGSTVTLSITDAIGKEIDGYQYYAFQKTGDIEANASATVATSPLYLGTYLSYTDTGNVLKSWSGKTPQGNYTMGDAISYAGANGTGYTISGWYQRQLINAYYMMKYGNPDSQSVIGRGFVDGNSAATATGGTNSQTNATYGESTGKYSVKLFGLEDWRGNQNQRVGGIFTDGSKNLYAAIHSFTANMSTSESQYKGVGQYTPGTSNPDISAIVGTNKGMFYPSATVNNSSYNTYWCDYGFVNASRLAFAGGYWNDGSVAGAFHLFVILSASYSAAYIGARLMFL